MVPAFHFTELVVLTVEASAGCARLSHGRWISIALILDAISISESPLNLLSYQRVQIAQIMECDGRMELFLVLDSRAVTTRQDKSGSVYVQH